MDILGSIDYSGQNRKWILRNNPGMIKHPFALSLFEDIIYFTDWSPGSIRKVNKLHGGSKYIFKTFLKKPMDIQVVHPIRQPVTEEYHNYCNKSDCSHLCVLKPNGYSCKCPYGYQFYGNNVKQCERK